MFYRLIGPRHNRTLKIEGEAAEIGPSFSPEEDAFFSSGGETAIPGAGAAPAGGDTGEDGKAAGAEAPGAAKPGDPPKMVNLSALHESRTAEKEARKEARRLELENAELKGKFSIIERLQTPAAEVVTPPAPPTPEEDIFGAVKHTGETLAQIQKRLDDADAATKAAADDATARTTFANEYKADAAKFTETAPDYMAAYNFLLNSRAADLRALGHDTPESLHNALTADEFALATFAKSKGKSPASMVYEMAKARGYKLAAAAPAVPDPDAKPGKAAEMIDTIAAGQAANKSLSDLGGEAPGGAMTAAQLIAMPMAEFEAWTAKNPAKAKALMGG